MKWNTQWKYVIYLDGLYYFVLLMFASLLQLNDPTVLAINRILVLVFPIMQILVIVAATGITYSHLKSVSQKQGKPKDLQLQRAMMEFIQRITIFYLAILTSIFLFTSLDLLEVNTINDLVTVYYDLSAVFLVVFLLIFGYAYYLAQSLQVEGSAQTKVKQGLQNYIAAMIFNPVSRLIGVLYLVGTITSDISFGSIMVGALGGFLLLSWYLFVYDFNLKVQKYIDPNSDERFLD